MKWLDGWSERLVFAVDHTQLNSNIKNLPLLLVLDNTLIDFSKLNNDGSDIRIVPANHSKIVPFEFELFDIANEQIKIWLTLDYIHHTIPTFFYLYYGNSSASSAENPSLLWSSCDCILCLHFRENDLFTDSSGLNTIDANSGSTTFTANGAIGSCWDINTDSYIRFPYISQYGSLHNWTGEVYGYQKTTGVYWNGILGTRFGSDYTFDMKIKNDGNKNVHKARIDVGNGSRWIHYEDYGNNIGVTWFHMAFTVTKPQFNYYQNGVRTDYFNNRTSDTPLFMKSSETLQIGRSRASEYGRYLLDEVRIYNTAKSSSYINASYKAINNQLIIYDQPTVKSLYPTDKMLWFML